MIGNDIIDLSISLSSNKSDNIRFLVKVFSQEEIIMIRESKKPDILLWQLWSMKEAAYKAHQRAFGLSRKLNPKSYRCFLNSDGNSGTVEIDKTVYSVETEINSKYIHSLVYQEKLLQKIYFDISYSKENLLKNIEHELSLDNEVISMLKDSNEIPSLFLKRENIILPFSLSHHGDFTAFTIPLINS